MFKQVLQSYATVLDQRAAKRVVVGTHATSTACWSADPTPIHLIVGGGLVTHYQCTQPRKNIQCSSIMHMLRN